VTEVYTKLSESNAILLFCKVCFESVGILLSAACLFMDVISYYFSRAVISCIGVDHTWPVVMMPTAIICYQSFNRLCVGMYGVRQKELPDLGGA
jgi:hypothetical protein